MIIIYILTIIVNLVSQETMGQPPIFSGQCLIQI